MDRSQESSSRYLPVPVWDFLEFLAGHPELHPEDVFSAPFQIEIGGQRTDLTINEYLAESPLVETTYSVTAQDVVTLNRMLHEFGAIEWDDAQRVHRYSDRDLRPVYAAWRSTLKLR